MPSDQQSGKHEESIHKRGIFLSYRRQDGPAFAGRLYDRLKEKFGKEQIFMDVDSIEYGLDFVDELDRALSHCRVLLAIIGPNWMSPTGANGEARIHDPEDYVRLEIERGLDRPDVRVIPILIDNAHMPTGDQLPRSIQPLRHRHACIISHERFGMECNQLITVIEGVISASRPGPEIPTGLARDKPPVQSESHHGESSITDWLQISAERRRMLASLIDSLTQVAQKLEMQEIVQELSGSKVRVEADTYNLIVMGRFKNGKSTLLNALLGATTKPVYLEGRKGPMVVDDLPATATLTAVRYADEPYVRAWTFDGRYETWPMSRYLHESTLEIDDEENRTRFGNIREFEMGFPSRLCQAGVTLVDSPGFDEHELRNRVTRDATARCDAAIVVYRSDVLMGQGEMMDAAELAAAGTHIFTVINLFGGREVNGRLRGYVWNRFVRDILGGPQWDNQDLSTRDIYFLDAKTAQDARWAGADADAGGSGLAALERRLGEYLVIDRQQVHLGPLVANLMNLARTIEQELVVGQKSAGLFDRKRRKELAALSAEVVNCRIALLGIS